ncbi:MAG: hypothetical protein ACI8RZ_004650 [Myxococcota bacterium]|jgi:hypothetical protein
MTGAEIQEVFGGAVPCVEATSLTSLMGITTLFDPFAIDRSGSESIETEFTRLVCKGIDEQLRHGKWTTREMSTSL